MCIIVYKPAGEPMLKNSIIENCFYNNSDGAGLMYRQPDKSIKVVKGFMDLPALQKALKDLGNLKNADLVLHFRLATQGSVCPENCHPFPISNNKADLRATEIVSRGAVVHNGVIDFCYARGKDALSDTQIFIRDYISTIPSKQLRNPAILGLIEEAANSKFVIMTRDDTQLLGKFIEDKGIYYSNSTYKMDRVIVKRGKYDYLWDSPYKQKDTGIAGPDPLGDCFANLELECDYDCKICPDFRNCPYQQCDYDCATCAHFDICNDPAVELSRGTLQNK